MGPKGLGGPDELQQAISSFIKRAKERLDEIMHQMLKAKKRIDFAMLSFAKS